jgi:superfamily II DNA/RNA helicase
MSAEVVSRDELCGRYLDLLPYAPYPVQEEALLAWFTSNQGVLVCAPTGTGKTLIAEAACYEALATGKTTYYTTPLIALTEQKFAELREAAVRWGFSADDVGLVTGHRRVNPDAKVLVVVAEILLNRLLHPDGFDFTNVLGVVMDEFHSFSDPERGIVWEFALSLLPKHVRLLLLSATVGNEIDFLLWLERCHGRRLELARSSERKVPLTFRWVPDMLLNDLLEDLAVGDAETRKTPALVFCFNRDECWNVAEQMKGKSLLADGQQKQLVEELAREDFTKGVGPKLKQILLRGVGVHHAGLLPRYKRIVETLFQKKLLTICVCTETLAAGINLPARTVVLPSLMKGPPGRQKLIDPSSAHQIFGRAGRPQFDTQGFVYVIPHEDDVRILRWKEKYDQIPEDTRDPQLIKAKKALKKKMPTRNPERQYWNDQQFEKLRISPPGNLISRCELPWRMLAYLLQISPDVEEVRKVLAKRLLDSQAVQQGEKRLDRMLMTLHAAEFVTLEPPPPLPKTDAEGSVIEAVAEPTPVAQSWLSQQLQKALDAGRVAEGKQPVARPEEKTPQYQAKFARPTDKLPQLFVFRSINPLYGMYLLDYLGLAAEAERLQLLESVLEFPRSLLRYVRVPPPHRLPPGPLAVEKVDAEIVARGLLPAGDLYPTNEPGTPAEERKYAPTLAEKVGMLFDSDYPGLPGLNIVSAWVAGDLLEFGGDFNKFVTGRDLAKQEGLIFKHLLRLILLLGEFRQVTPTGMDPIAWREWLVDLSGRLTAACHEVDPQSTEYALAHAEDRDMIQGEPEAADTGANSDAVVDDFGTGLDDE